jgi:hypothetical protein
MSNNRGRDLLILLLGAVLAYLIYRHYSTGRDLQRICELIGPHVATETNPSTPQQEIDNICISHQPDGF